MSKARFVKGSIPKHFITMSIPSLIAILANFSIAAVDTYFIARLGKNQLTAISFIFPIMDIITGVSLGVGIACSTVVAQLLGRNNIKRARSYASTGLIYSFIFSLILIILGFSFNNVLFHALGVKSPIVAHHIWQFMSIWYIGLIFYLALFATSFIMRAHGAITLSSIFFMIASLLNLLFDPILIFGFGPIPAMGLSGSALAGLIARLTMFIGAMVVMVKYDYITLDYKWRYFTQHCKKFMSHFIPASITNFIPPISTAFTTYLLAKHSMNAVAAFGLSSRIQAIAMIPLFALSGSLNPIVAQNFGGKLYNRVSQSLRFCINICFAWGLSVAVLLILSKGLLIRLFTHNPQIDAIARLYFDIVPLSYLGWGIIMMLSAYYNATARPTVSTIISLLRMIVIFMPLALILNYYYSYTGVFLALCLSNLSVALGGLYINRQHFSVNTHFELPNKPSTPR